MARPHRRLTDPAHPFGSLAGVLEGVIDGDPLRVTLTNSPAPDAASLLQTLGAIVSVNPNAVKPCDCRPASGRSVPTRVQMSEETRKRQRESYFLREDKRQYAPK